MEHIWGRFYRWPKDKDLIGYAHYSEFTGNAVYWIGDNETTGFIKLPFVNIWVRGWE